jgi:hypothetical protein
MIRDHQMFCRRSRIALALFASVTAAARVLDHFANFALAW